MSNTSYTEKMLIGLAVVLLLAIGFNHKYNSTDLAGQDTTAQVTIVPNSKSMDDFSDFFKYKKQLNFIANKESSFGYELFIKDFEQRRVLIQKVEVWKDGVLVKESYLGPFYTIDKGDSRHYWYEQVIGKSEQVTDDNEIAPKLELLSLSAYKGTEDARGFGPTRKTFDLAPGGRLKISNKVEIGSEDESINVLAYLSPSKQKRGAFNSPSINDLSTDQFIEEYVKKSSGFIIKIRFEEGDKFFAHSK